MTRTLGITFLFASLLFLRSANGASTELINETGFGPTQIGYVLATVTGPSQPLRRGGIVLSLASLGEPIGQPVSCFAEGGCGSVALTPDVTSAYACSTRSGKNHQGDLAFDLSGTFCQEPSGAWTYSGSFSVTSKGGEPAVGNGTIEAAGGAGNGQSVVTLYGVLAQ